MATKFLDLNGLQRVVNNTKSLINAKQDALISGTNIKTINGQSLLGSGNLTISGGDGNSILYTHQITIHFSNGNNTYDLIVKIINTHSQAYTTIEDVYTALSESAVGGCYWFNYVPVSVCYDDNNEYLKVFAYNPNTSSFNVFAIDDDNGSIDIDYVSNYMWTHGS